MSLVGFRAENHPQQIGKRAARDDVDDRGTALEHFAAFDAEFGPFTLDVAAAPHNAKCERYYTREQNGLLRPWHGTVWCNPPYSNMGVWVAKAWAEMQRPTSAIGLAPPARIVMLAPANRCEQRWWQEHVEPYRDTWGPMGRYGATLRVRFLPGRMRFIRPSAVIGARRVTGRRSACCLLIWSRS